MVFLDTIEFREMNMKRRKEFGLVGIILPQMRKDFTVGSGFKFFIQYFTGEPCRTYAVPREDSDWFGLHPAGREPRTIS